jgi:hypothetical protein
MFYLFYLGLNQQKKIRISSYFVMRDPLLRSRTNLITQSKKTAKMLATF